MQKLQAKIDTTLKLIFIYQIAGGVLGALVLLWNLMTASASNSLSIGFMLFGVVLFAFSIYSGVILSRFPSRGLKLSIYNQALQVIGFSLLGYGYQYIAGVSIQVGIDLTNDFQINFLTGLPSLNLSMNKNKELLLLNVNVIAAYIIWKLQQVESWIGVE